MIYEVNCKYEIKISLPVSVGNTACIVEFLIVSAPSPYNCIMGCPALNQLHDKISTCNLAMEVLVGEEVQVIYGD